MNTHEQSSKWLQPKQYRIIKMSNSLAEVIREQPDLIGRIVAMWLKGMTEMEIAENIRPLVDPENRFGLKPVHNAVSRTIVSTLAPELRFRIAGSHHRSGHEFTIEERQAGLKAMGRDLWLNETLFRLFELAWNTGPRHETGRWEGKPDYEEIAVILNKEFGLELTGNQCASYIRTFRYRMKKVLKIGKQKEVFMQAHSVSPSDE